MNDQKVALITGAGQGIGAACARRLKAGGYRLALMSPSTNSITLAEELNAFAIQGSVTSPADLQNLVDGTIERYGRIDAIVNNTGHAPGFTREAGPAYDPELQSNLVDLSDLDWQKGFELVFLNVVRMARLATPALLKNGGSIVNVTTFAAREPRLSFPVSSPLRLGVSGYMKLYADSYARFGIRMNNVLPGYIDTIPLQDEIRRWIPAGREGTVEDIAAAVSFLLSDDAAYITGQNIVVDGGLTRLAV